MLVFHRGKNKHWKPIIYKNLMLGTYRDIILERV